MNRASIAFLALLSACRAPVDFEERRLDSIPEGGSLLVPASFSANGREVAYVLQTDEGAWAVRGSWKSRRLDAM